MRFIQDQKYLEESSSLLICLLSPQPYTHSRRGSQLEGQHHYWCRHELPSFE